MDDKVIVDLLGQVGNLFTSSLELKETIDFMLKAAADLVDCDAATVFLLDEDGKALSAIATFPFTDNLGQVARFELGEGIVGWAAQRRKLVSVADATKDRRFKTLGLAYAPRSCLVMPLESPQRLVGALTLARREVQPFTSIEQALMRIIASQAAISIDNARLYTAQRAQLGDEARVLRRCPTGDAQRPLAPKRRSGPHQHAALVGRDEARPGRRSAVTPGRPAPRRPQPGAGQAPRRRNGQTAEPPASPHPDPGDRLTPPTTARRYPPRSARPRQCRRPETCAQ